MLSGRRRVDPIRIGMGGMEVVCVKYLGVWLDKTLCFKVHISKTAERAGKLVSVMSRLMRRVGDPRSTKSRVLTRIVNSVIHHAVPVWSDSIKTRTYAAQLETAQRTAEIRVCTAYQTLSSKTSLIVAVMIPIC